jgi:hypothetical protein
MASTDCFSLYETLQLIQLLCHDFPLDKIVFAAKILGYGGDLLKSVPTFDHSELALRESGFGNERFPFGEFCDSLKVYFAYHGCFIPF